MGPKEKIGRSVMMMVDGMRDAVTAELATALSALQLDRDSIERIVATCRSTIDTSYVGGSRVIDREISEAFTAAASSHSIVQQVAKSTKKKGPQAHCSSCNDS